MAGSTSNNEEPATSSFYGVYLLYTLNPKYKGRTYIGFTVDPNRRIKQHNKGKQFGGACRTSNRGPWEMILIVHGFPNMISALRFEWAWQHPKRSRRLAHLPAKKAREKMFEYNFRLLSEMLNLGPWNRLPLTVRWLRPDLKFAEFPQEKRPPNHILVMQGPLDALKSKKLNSKEQEDDDKEDRICSICFVSVPPEDRVQCQYSKCGAMFHIVCLAARFRAQSEEETTFIIPVHGTCPVCEQLMRWGDAIANRPKYDRVEPLEEQQAPAASQGNASDQDLFD